MKSHLKARSLYSYKGKCKIKCYPNIWRIITFVVLNMSIKDIKYIILFLDYFKFSHISPVHLEMRHPPPPPSPTNEIT